MTNQKEKLPPGVYLGDNGRCLCDRHLGMTASMTGRDLSGQPVLRVTAETIRTNGFASEADAFRCETCGATDTVAQARADKDADAKRGQDEEHPTPGGYWQHATPRRELDELLALNARLQAIAAPSTEASIYTERDLRREARAALKRTGYRYAGFSLRVTNVGAILIAHGRRDDGSTADCQVAI